MPVPFDSPPAIPIAADDPPGARIGPRPRRGPLLHIVLFLATFVTMTMAGAFFATGEFLRLTEGLSYSLCLVAILGAHEMGHYLVCRHYGVDASFPYFLPGLPLPMGTFGAFIRIRAPIPSRKVLFDIGVAGPIAGFVVAIPVLVYGILTARAIPAAGGPLDEPLLMSWVSAILSPPLPEGSDFLLSGPLHAAYVGLFATAFNLFPVGQLDGGHLCYALSSRFHRLASLIGIAGFIVMGFSLFSGWLFLATLLLVFGPKHPPVVDETEGLSKGRLLVAAFALLMLIVCFIPRPFIGDVP